MASDSKLIALDLLEHFIEKVFWDVNQKNLEHS